MDCPEILPQLWSKYIGMDTGDGIIADIKWYRNNPQHFSIKYLKGGLYFTERFTTLEDLLAALPDQEGS